MKKMILTTIVILMSFAAKAESAGYYRDITGQDVFGDHSLNQYDDVENPPQAYRIKLPDGYRLMSADVKSEGWAVCGLSGYNSQTKTFKIEGYDIETDSGSCAITLTIWDVKNKKEVKATYSIEQVGT